MPSSLQPPSPATTLPRLRRLLARAAKNPQPETVHHLRTGIRRAEALLQQAAATDRKLAKRLRRLRHRAGAVRDLDVQAGLVRGLHIGSDGARRQALVEVLESRRLQHAAKLARALRDPRRRQLNQRLRRAELALVEAQSGHTPPPVAPGVLRRFRALQTDFPLLSPDNLHAFRTACKRLRYLAETGLPHPDAAALVLQLKQVQDDVGAWHDWSELTAVATAEFGADSPGALLPALRATTAARFRDALATALAVREHLLLRDRTGRLALGPGRRPPAPGRRPPAAAVAPPTPAAVRQLG